MDKEEIAFRISQFSRPPIGYSQARRIAEKVSVVHNPLRDDMAEAGPAPTTGQPYEPSEPVGSSGGAT